MDSKGIDSASLRVLLESWPTGKPNPKVLYTVPVSVFGDIYEVLRDG